MREGALELTRALDFSCQICNAVDHAHRAGILHRDLRPGNMLVSESGMLKVTDFGTSRFLEIAAHGTTVIGSPPYMAPEQFHGKAVFASDIYSVGVTMYQMLTGSLPYDTPAPADLARLARGELRDRAANEEPQDSRRRSTTSSCERWRRIRPRAISAPSDVLNDILAARDTPAPRRRGRGGATGPRRPTSTCRTSSRVSRRARRRRRGSAGTAASRSRRGQRSVRSVARAISRNQFQVQVPGSRFRSGTFEVEPAALEPGPGTGSLDLPDQAHNLLVQILLLSMPDSFEHTPTLAVRMPNGALASLAGNVDAHHQVAIADLVLAQSSVQATVTRLMRELQPDLVGLSVMTFQRSTARRIISLVKSLKPDVRRSWSAATIRRSRQRRGRIPRSAWTSSSAAKATSPSASWCARSTDKRAAGQRRRALVPHG